MQGGLDMKILVVEDEEFIRNEIITMLKEANYEVFWISEFKNTTQQILNNSVDLILLDLNLPYENGFEICRSIKEKCSIPILILTSRDKLNDEVSALKLGADDYITKPFRRERLLIRIENLLKRFEINKNLLKYGDIQLDKNTYTLYYNSKSYLLPNNQGKLLEEFLNNKCKVISKEQLSMKLWDTVEFIDENALQVNMTRLKKTLKEIKIPYIIKSVRAKGYVLSELVNSEMDPFNEGEENE